jgi:outer membrane protein OmpA-like peptidoglycan-associated protein
MNAAAQGRDIAGSSDFVLFQRFTDSHIVDYRNLPDTTYTLVLGRMQRVDGRVTPGNSQRLQGALTRITYEIPAAYTAEDVYTFFRQQLLRGSETALFVCQGRACGSSNFWANEVFSNRVLYGPEANQYYLAANPVAGAEDRNIYAALYVVTRANRRVYAHLDILELPSDAIASVAVSPEALLQRLQREGSVVMPGLSFDNDDKLLENAGVELAVRVLRNNPLLRIYVVGHLYESGDLEALTERSQTRAMQIRQALVDAGIGSDRIIAQGVGPLAPACSSRPCEQRIELVLQP